MEVCNNCPLAPLNNFTSVKPRGNIDGNLFFIGEAPGYKERKLGYTFVGKAGMLLQAFVNEYSLTDFAYYTNAIKCRPPNNRTPYPIELKTCRPKLLQEIGNGKPSIIVLLGNTAINQFFNAEINNVTKLNNKVIRVGNSFIIFGFHPAYILRSDEYHHYYTMFKKIRILYKLFVNKYI